MGHTGSLNSPGNRKLMSRRPQFEMIVGSHKIHLGARTLIMGVLNVTPDSFSDGGCFLDSRRAIRHALEMAHQGADWIDVGGESTRPGAQPVSAEEELRRVLPVIRGIQRHLPGLPVSIDTTKALVAEEALHAGASIVNDVSGLRFDSGIADVVRRFRAPLVLMHLRRRPASMQRKPFARSIGQSLARGLGGSVYRALNLGVPRSQIILDPGLGFGKTRRQNFEILAHLNHLQRFHLPVLVGASRKSFIQAVVAGEELKPVKKKTGGYWKLTGARRAHPAAEASRERNNTEFPWHLDFGDAAAAVAAVLGGAHIVRVHNVATVLPAVRIADAILAAESGE